MIRITLTDTTNIDPDKSLLVRAGLKLKHPKAYSRGSNHEEFKGFIANILRWLKMNYLLRPISTDLQVSYMGTCLTGEAQEWFHQNTECFNHQVHEWTLETVVRGCRKDSCTPLHTEKINFILYVNFIYA
jgi:hypothetical protein